jgi:type II secretory pathway component GspD/PulD (secretin)
MNPAARQPFAVQSDSWVLTQRHTQTLQALLQRLATNSSGKGAGSEATQVDPVQSVTTTTMLERSLDSSPSLASAENPVLPLIQDPLPEGKQIGISVADLELQQVLKIIAEQSGVSVVLAAKENPKITVQLSRMPLVDVLRVIAALTNLRFLRVGVSYVVASEDVLKTSFPAEWALQYPTSATATTRTVMQTYVCQSVSASQAVRLLTTMFPKDELKVEVGPAPIVPSFGSGASGGGSAVTGGSSSSTGSASSTSQGGVQSGTTGSADRTLVIRGEEKMVEEAMALLRKIDVQRPQIQVKVEIVDVNNEALRDLGITWTASNTVVTERAPRGVNFGSFDRNAQSFTGVVRILENRSQAKTLATPVIAMMDGQTGYVLIGQRINYPVVIGTTPNNTPIFDIKEERVGVYLQVGATVNDAGEITLNLYPQVSTITGFLQVQGASYPQVATREAQTTLRVKNGETVIVGGLIRDEEIQNWDKVPILSEIPILGELFKKRRTSRIASQVIVSITPTIIK